MARTEKVLTIFLASPSDVINERSRLEEVISEWNTAWSREFGLRLDLLRWETHAFPAIGCDAQDVINRQIHNDYDIFIGIMWSRFGTPTGRFGSGTEEEFERALDRNKITDNKPEILFYFKDAPISPSKMDVQQLDRVQKFKKRLSDEGVLTWDFVDFEGFDNSVRMHIIRHVNAWRKSQEFERSAVESGGLGICTSKNAQPFIEMESPADDDLGYFDYLDEVSDRYAEMTEIVERITKAQLDLTEQTIKGTNELVALQDNSEGGSTKQVRRSIARVADEMIRYTARVEMEVPLYRVAVDKSMTALISAATITAEMYPEKMRETKGAATQLLATLISSRKSAEGFLESTKNLPRMTKELNVAKRKQIVVLEALIIEFAGSERLMVEALSIIDGLQ